MPYFDLCTMDGSEDAIFAALFFIGGLLIGLALSSLSHHVEKRNGRSSNPIKFSLGCAAPVFATGLFTYAVNLIFWPRHDCGFTPDAVIFLLLTPLTLLGIFASFALRYIARIRQ